jgi:hypothetical protein
VASASDRLLELVRDQLTAERARKGAIEQQGITVVTTSGTVVALLFGITALATRTQDYVLPPGASISLGVAGVLFVAAALCAILISWALSYIEVTVEGLRDLQKANWAIEEEEASKAVTKAWTDIIEGARDRNMAKAKILHVAIFLEVLAFAAVTVGVMMVLAGI